MDAMVYNVNDFENAKNAISGLAEIFVYVANITCVYAVLVYTLRYNTIFGKNAFLPMLFVP